jgi:hypothetical protein
MKERMHMQYTVVGNSLPVEGGNRKESSGVSGKQRN